jgi:hypothetical protein
MHFRWWDVLVAGKKPWVKRAIEQKVIDFPIEMRRD